MWCFSLLCMMLMSKTVLILLHLLMGLQNDLRSSKTCTALTSVDDILGETVLVGISGGNFFLHA